MKIFHLKILKFKILKFKMLKFKIEMKINKLLKTIERNEFRKSVYYRI